ncbi:MAG: hypothetical protein AB1705_08510 [Verrucomicrobiota bacterium]
MNLADMAAHVCGKVRKTDSAALAKCKGFIRQRNELIYNDQLWRDSLYQFDFTFSTTALADPNTATVAEEGIWLLPRVVDRVVALRTSDRGLAPVAQEILFRQDPDRFAESGNPVEFYKMSPVVWQFGVAGADAVALYVEAENAADAGSPVHVRYISVLDELIQETINAVVTAGLGGFSGLLSASVKEIVSFSKGATAGYIWLNNGTGTRYTALGAAETSHQRYPRLRIMTKPNQDTAMKALVKKRHQPLTYDYDEPDLLGIENTLLAFAQGDMLEWMRQYSKANLKFQEALGLLEAYKIKEVAQEAALRRFIPEGEAADYELSKADF